MLAALQTSRRKIDLGPRPGKLKSNVWAPAQPQSLASSGTPVADGGSGPDAPLSVPEGDGKLDNTSPSAHKVVGQRQGVETAVPPLSIADANGPDMVNLDSSDVEL